MPSSGNPKLAFVPPDAHRRADSIDRWRFWAPCVAVVLLVVWRAADHLLHAVPGPGWHSPGPVASPHATWEADCAVCHPSFKPVSATKDGQLRYPWWFGKARTYGYLIAAEKKEN